MKFQSKTDDGMTAKQIFAEINKRQVLALMFHREMSLYYDFLSLVGFKRWHEYQYKEENNDNIRLNHYFIEHNNELIPEETVSAVQIIPAEWYTVMRTNVGIVTKKNYTVKGMAEYVELEDETKTVYQKYQSMLMAMGRTKDACMVGKLVCGVDDELKRLEKMVENLKFVDYDPIYIAEIQKPMHDKYKKMMKE